jgi:hypothetical protein
MRWFAAVLTASLVAACGLGPQPEIPGSDNGSAPDVPKPGAGGQAGPSGENTTPPPAAADAAPARGPGVAGGTYDVADGGDAASDASVPLKEGEGADSAKPESDDAADDRGDAEGGSRRRPTQNDGAAGGDARASQGDDAGDAAHDLAADL